MQMSRSERREANDAAVAVARHPVKFEKAVMDGGAPRHWRLAPVLTRPRRIHPGEP